MERLPHATNGQNICHSSDGPDGQYVRVIGSVWVYSCVFSQYLALIVSVLHYWILSYLQKSVPYQSII